MTLGTALQCDSCGLEALVQNGIPRFVGQEHLASFGLQWNREDRSLLPLGLAQEFDHRQWRQRVENPPVDTSPNCESIQFARQERIRWRFGLGLITVRR